MGATPISYSFWHAEDTMNLPKFEFDLAKAEEEFKKAWDGKVWENGLS